MENGRIQPTFTENINEKSLKQASCSFLYSV